MKKRIVLALLTIISIFFISSVIYVNAKGLTKDEYKQEITRLNEEIDELEGKIEYIKEQIKLQEEQYQQLETELNGMMTKEDMYDWFDQCNTYNTRSNLSVKVKHYNKFIIVTGSSYEYGSAFIFAKSGSTYYALTSYFIVTEDDYKYHDVTITDAFRNEYTATIYNQNESYGMAILKFTNSNTNNLYVSKFAKSNPNENDPICNIFTIKDSAFNHMNFTKIQKYTTSSYVSFNVIQNTIDKYSAIGGAMSVDFDGKVVGMVISITNTHTYCRSVPVEKILSYVKANGCSVS